MTSLFAHRGHHTRWPENSVAAVAAAREVGADGVEIDVWQTTDKSLVVNHDRYFGRHDVTRCSSAQLEATTLISTLAEVLEAAGELRINVEIKSTRSAPYNMAVAREVSAFLDASRVSHRCLVSSFSLAICDEVRAVSPTRRIGWLVTRRRADFVLDTVSAHSLTSAHLPFSRVSGAVVRRAQDLGIELHVWTPNLERDLDRMLDLGVGALITDDVPLARALRAHHARTTGVLPSSNHDLD